MQSNLGDTDIASFQYRGITIILWNRTALPEIQPCSFSFFSWLSSYCVKIVDNLANFAIKSGIKTSSLYTYWNAPNLKEIWSCVYISWKLLIIVLSSWLFTNSRCWLTHRSKPTMFYFTTFWPFTQDYTLFLQHALNRYFIPCH